MDLQSITFAAAGCGRVPERSQGGDL